jgi:hypothetical protein
MWSCGLCPMEGSCTHYNEFLRTINVGELLDSLTNNKYPKTSSFKLLNVAMRLECDFRCSNYPIHLILDHLLRVNTTVFPYRCNHLSVWRVLERLGSRVAASRYQQVHEVGSCDKSDVTLNGAPFPGRAPCLIFNHNDHKSLLGRVTRLQSQQKFQLTKHVSHILFPVRTLGDFSSVRRALYCRCKKSGRIHFINCMTRLWVRLILSKKWHFQHMQGRLFFIIRDRPSPGFILPPV